jgi:hypothetical protein
MLSPKLQTLDPKPPRHDCEKGFCLLTELFSLLFSVLRRASWLHLRIVVYNKRLPFPRVGGTCLFCAK